MFILARGGQTFAELSWLHGGPASIPLDVEIDFTPPFEGSDAEAWEAEYLDCVEPHTWHEPRAVDHRFTELDTAEHSHPQFPDRDLWPDLIHEFDSPLGSRAPRQ